MVGREERARKREKNEVDSLEEESSHKDSLLRKKKKKKKKCKRHEDSGDDFALSSSQKEVHADVNDEVNKNEKKRRKRKLEHGDDEKESQVVRKKNKVVKDGGELTEVRDSLQGNVVEGQKEPEREELAKMNNGEEGDYKKEKEKRKQLKKYDGDGDTEVIRSVTDGKVVGNGREELDANIIDKVDSTRREKKKKKKRHDVVLEAETASKERSVIEGDVSNASPTTNKASDGKLKVNAEGRNRDERRKMKERGGSDNGGDVVMDSGTDEKAEVSNGREFLNGIIMETVANAKETNKKKKKKEKKKKQKHTVNSDIAPQELMYEKQGDESCETGENEHDVGSAKRKARGTKIEDHDVTAENKNKRKKAKSLKNGSEGEYSERTEIEEDVGTAGPSEKSTSKRVSFCEDVEVFQLSDGPSDEKDAEEDGLVRGKRFSLEEDEMLKEAVLNYIDAHGLGEEGLNMVLNCRKHAEVKNCWKEISAAIPWRPHQSIYYRAHILFERDQNRSWTTEEYELIRKFHEKHGSDWKTLAEVLGKHRFHVKDTWRRIKPPNMKKGKWSQDEYQSLFELVNLDLRMKVCEERKTKHGMLRDNIAWTAISERLETRTDSLCCQKWYDQLTSPMVAEGKWLDTDDYRLLMELYDLDACCMEDVEWDDLLEHRSGDLCRKRWNQMVKHLGDHQNKSFADQVDILIKRYCPDVLEARETYNNKPAVD